MDWIFKAIIGGIAYLIADEVVKEKTGKRIHSHVFEWWTSLRDDINAWALKNSHTNTHKFIMYVDKAIVAGIRIGKKVHAQIFGISDNGTRRLVTTTEVSPDELQKQIPEFRQHTAVDITALVC